jgi:hypothetical protein
MSIHEFRCGSSAAAFSPVPAKSPTPEDKATVRLLTRLHLNTARPTPAGFRVVGVGPEGCETLVCLACTRVEAADRMRAEAGCFSMLHLQCWVGTTFAGHWQTIAHRARKDSRASGRRGLRRQQAGHLGANR